MRHTPVHASEDPEFVKELVREFPWATLVSPNLTASHYPVILDETASTPTLLTHVGRPDEQHHALGDHELLVIVQGHHGYISPSWYAPEATRAPTWNFSVAHLYGTPELLPEEENLAVLGRLVEHFERAVEAPMLLDPEWGRPVARGTVGLRIPITRFVCKRKLSLDKDPETQRRVIARLREPGPYSHPALADEMERIRSQSG